jgi:hypothetical protein
MTATCRFCNANIRVGFRHGLPKTVEAQERGWTAYGRAAAGFLGDLLRAQIGYADRAWDLLLATNLGRVQLLRGRDSLAAFLGLRFQLGLPGRLACRDTLRKDELYAQRVAAREAAWRAELKELEKEHRTRVAANKKLYAAQVRRQKEFLRSIGVPDLSPEEITEKASGALKGPRRASARAAERRGSGAPYEAVGQLWSPCVMLSAPPAG